MSRVRIRRPSSTKLVSEHMKEIERKGAEVYNLGWAMTENGIASKTSGGILDTEWSASKGFTHEWDESQ